jgi:ADP-heptose:LPS heptosyltransferase
MVLARKRWLPERWAAVADGLHSYYGARLLIVGSGDEAGIVRTVQEATNTRAQAIARQWRWGVLGAVIEQADLFLGHDTGMSLLANAVGTPHVVVFGPSDPQVYGPYGRWGRYVWHPTAPSPCFFEGSAPAQCPCAGACMRRVQVEDVLDLVEELWQQRKGKWPLKPLQGRTI